MRIAYILLATSRRDSSFAHSVAWARASAERSGPIAGAVYSREPSSPTAHKAVPCRAAMRKASWLTVVPGPSMMVDTVWCGS